MIFGNSEPNGEEWLSCLSLEVLEHFRASCEATEKHETFGVKKSNRGAKRIYLLLKMRELFYDEI